MPPTQTGRCSRCPSKRGRRALLRRCSARLECLERVRRTRSNRPRRAPGQSPRASAPSITVAPSCHRADRSFSARPPPRPPGRSPALAPVVPRVADAARPAADGSTGRDAVVALTFDDGPHPEGTPAVLEALQAGSATAIFFLCGEQVDRDPEPAAEIAAAGHTVASPRSSAPQHAQRSPRGPSSTTSSAASRRSRMRSASRPDLYRPPYGIFSLRGYREREPTRLDAAAVVTLGPRLARVTARPRQIAAGGGRATQRRRRAAAPRRGPLQPARLLAAARSRRCPRCWSEIEAAGLTATALTDGQSVAASASLCQRSRSARATTTAAIARAPSSDQSRWFPCEGRVDATRRPVPGSSSAEPASAGQPRKHGATGRPSATPRAQRQQAECRQDRDQAGDRHVPCLPGAEVVDAEGEHPRRSRSRRCTPGRRSRVLTRRSPRPARQS